MPSFLPTLALIALILLAFAWRRRLRWKPAYALRLALLALALLAATFSPPPLVSSSPIPPRQVLILDLSDSIPSETRADSLAQAKTWQSIEANRLVILVGAQAEPVTGEDWPVVNGRATDLAEAIHLAENLLGDRPFDTRPDVATQDRPGQITLATDARPTDPLAVQSAISNIHSPIQIIPLETLSLPGDLSVGPLYAPPSMWQGLSFQAILPIYAPRTGEATLQVFQNDELLADEIIPVREGLNLQPLNLQTFDAEIMTLQATVAIEGDPRPENDTAYAALRVFPAPRVLVITENLEVAATLAASTGLDTDYLTPSELPPSLTGLDPYQVIFLHNFLATSLTDAQMRTLKDFSFQLGRGLIFIGGRNAYTLGGYKDTLLEPILPVTLEPPPRPQSDALTFILAFDRSSSMGQNPGAVRDQNRTPLALAREAALRAVETLGPEDYLGILAYNSDTGWILPLGPASEGKKRALDALTQVTATGGTSIYNALTEAVNTLLDSPSANTRHLLLLSDGQSGDGTLDDFVALAQFARTQGITVSTIALGAEADHELMALIAEAGGGRYYPVQQATDLPKILVDESQAARGDNIVEGLVRPEQGEPNHPILSNFRAGLMPSLTGYNALQSKPGAEDVLVSGEFRDPLLSVWQYGLGRVAAWTGDLGEGWSADWTTWEGWGRFWSQVILYALPDPSLGSGQVEVEVLPETVHLTAQLQTTTGIPLNGLQVIYTHLDAGQNARTYQMSQTAPGQYELTLPRPPEGVYRGVVSYKQDAETRTEIAAPLVINYPTEWQTDPAGNDTITQANSQLEGWIASTGGSITDWETLNAPPPPPPPATPTPQQTLSRFLLALLLLWPLEIALRRKWMPWR